MSQSNLPDISDLNALRGMLSDEHPVRAVHWCGELGFAKRRTKLRGHERFLLAFAPVLRRWLAPGAPFTPRRYDPAVPVEVQRLREIRAGGQIVPEVLAADKDVFVSAYAGQTLESIIHEEPSREMRHGLLAHAARDLARFHNAGFWHGAAQIRNVIVSPEGKLGRIDFETSLDRHLPLPLLQAFDAALLFSSIARGRDAAALPAVAAAYQAHAPAPAREALKRGMPLLRALARSRLLRKLAPKEAERMRAIAGLSFN